MSADDDLSDDVQRFREEADYAEEHYDERGLTLPPHDQFRLLERDDTVYFPVTPEGEMYFAVTVVHKDETDMPEDDWVFWSGDGEEYHKEPYECQNCGVERDINLNGLNYRPDVKAPCPACGEDVVFEPSQR